MNDPKSPAAELLQLPSDLQPFYLAENDSFGVAQPEDDLLHPAINAKVKDDSLTETQFFSMCVPDERVYAMGYLWHHPNLGMLTGGIWGWQGIKRQNLACEMFDIRAFMHNRALDGDLHAYRLDNGYGVQILEPLQRHRMTYVDTARNNAVDVEFTAVAPPVMFGNGKHFEQPMRVRGELTLRGKRYDVDCYTVRDRSWGKPRPEIGMSLPPMGWKTGVFGDDFAFNCNGFDDPGLVPEFASEFPLPGNQALKAGWIFRDGRVSRIVSCSKRTVRDPLTLFPVSCDWTATDEHGRGYHFKGTALASSDWSVQPNLRFVISSMRWECDGRVAYGELQEGQWTDFIHRFLK
jgi:hypothetical protein